MVPQIDIVVLTMSVTVENPRMGPSNSNSNNNSNTDIVQQQEHDEYHQEDGSDSSLSLGDGDLSASRGSNPDATHSISSNSSLMSMGLTSTSTLTTRDQRTRPHCVSFSTVQIHQHLIILGDNPGALNRGPPLSISWKAFDTIILSVDDYEGITSGSSENVPRQRRPPTQLVLPSKQRHRILMELGYSRGEIREAIQEAEQIQSSRRRTNQQRRWDQTHSTLEKVSRKLHHCLTLGRAKRQELEWMRPFLPSTSATPFLSQSSSSSSSHEKRRIPSTRQRKQHRAQHVDEEEKEEGREASPVDPSTMMTKPRNDLFADSSQRSSTSTTTTTTTMLDMSESSCEVRFIADNNRTGALIC